MLGSRCTFILLNERKFGFLSGVSWCSNSCWHNAGKRSKHCLLLFMMSSGNNNGNADLAYDMEFSTDDNLQYWMGDSCSVDAKRRRRNQLIATYIASGDMDAAVKVAVLYMKYCLVCNDDVCNFLMQKCFRKFQHCISAKLCDIILAEINSALDEKGSKNVRAVESSQGVVDSVMLGNESSLMANCPMTAYFLTGIGQHILGGRVFYRADALFNKTGVKASEWPSNSSMEMHVDMGHEQEEKCIEVYEDDWSKYPIFFFLGLEEKFTLQTRGFVRDVRKRVGAPTVNATTSVIECGSVFFMSCHALHCTAKPLEFPTKRTLRLWVGFSLHKDTSFLDSY